MPDAPDFGDAGAHTLDHICEAAGAPDAPRLRALGLGNIEGVEAFPASGSPEAAFGKMSEASAGKDTITGHWEMAGVPLDRAFPTFPDGFDDELLDAIASRTGVAGWLCNTPASGTSVIEQYGPEHVETGKLIVYTSADSVLQIAAHEGSFGLERLLEVCEVARELTLEQGSRGSSRGPSWTRRPAPRNHDGRTTGATSPSRRPRCSTSSNRRACRSWAWGRSRTSSRDTG